MFTMFTVDFDQGYEKKLGELEQLCERVIEISLKTMDGMKNGAINQVGDYGHCFKSQGSLNLS